MKKIRKTLKLPEDLIEEVQGFANEKCEGNFSMAARVLMKKALNRHNELKVKL